MKIMKYKSIVLVSTLLIVTTVFSACGSTSSLNNKNKTKETPTIAEQSNDEIANIFGQKLIPEEQKEYYKKYFTKQFDGIRKDNLSDWKDESGNWCYPADYQITWIPSDDEKMAAQQFPKELLEDMSTEELFQFIRKAHGFWAQSAFENYAIALSGYYSHYNFIAELMQRDDCAEVVHKYYAKATDDDVKQYSKVAHMSYSDKGKTEKQELFQLMEGMEWFFLYKNGESVPDDRVFGTDLLADVQ